MIVVIDDDDAVRDYLCNLLEFAGYETVCASSGSDALRLIDSLEAPPRLLLLDLLMPEMHGWGLLGRLGADPRYAAIPVIVLSGISDQTPPSYPNIAARLSKPVDAKALLAEVRRLVPPPEEPRGDAAATRSDNAP